MFYFCEIPFFIIKLFIITATTTYSFVVWDFDHTIPRVKPEPVVKEDDKKGFKLPDKQEEVSNRLFMNVNASRN